jgi:hypothetical protein
MPNYLRRLIRMFIPVGITACVIAALPGKASAQSTPAAAPAANAVPAVQAIRDVNNPAEQPFAKRFYPSAASAATYTVPTGKRLVITDVAAFSYGSTTVEDVAIYTTTAGVGGARVIPFTVNNHGIVYATSAVSIVADAKSTVTIAIDDSDSTDHAGMNVDVHGYFVNHQ